MEDKMDVNATTAQNLKRASKIFEEHTHTIRAAIGFYVNDKSSIDDLFQDFFLSLVRRPIPRRAQNIRAFINRAIRNDVLDAVSQTQSYNVRNYKYAKMHADNIKSKTPDDIVSQAEEIRHIFDIVGSQLLQHETKAIIQKYRYDMDIGETAKAMNINKRSVSCYLCTGIRKLRKRVGATSTI